MSGEREIGVIRTITVSHDKGYIAFSVSQDVADAISMILFQIAPHARNMYTEVQPKAPPGSEGEGKPEKPQGDKPDEEGGQ